jgi:flavin reductase (DIM6/NTAB) family NADH-FMN oxidoreductase RutF
MDLAAFNAGLDYPVYVVTAAAGGRRSGCLVGFGGQVSIHPPRFSVCISEVNHTHPVALEAEVLAVHLLDRAQRDLAELFGGETGDEVDKFADCAWREGPGGVPVLLDAPRHLVGRVLGHRPLGDHTGFLLEPLEVSGGDLDPMMFSEAKSLEPGHPPEESAPDESARGQGQASDQT